MSSGVVYVATGKPYIKAAAMSIGSLRQFYHGAIMILTDVDALCLHRLAEYFHVDIVVHDTKEPHLGRSSRILKTQAAILCSYDEALFLDADTVVLKDIAALWLAPTDDAPLAMTKGCTYQTVGALNVPQLLAKPSLRWAEQYKLTVDVTGPNAPYYSSSTMVWHRTAAVLELFRVWYQEWARIRVSDMPALARALARTKVNVIELPRKFNARHKKQRNKETVIWTTHFNWSPTRHTEFDVLNKLTDRLLQEDTPPVLGTIIVPKQLKPVTSVQKYVAATNQLARARQCSRKRLVRSARPKSLNELKAQLWRQAHV